ncbi:MAG: GntR family transcriptional regulator [Atopobiaceae bacterium]|nr:GntR family transcriptional regulator [Atopobiaceae bacterium]
MQKYLTIVMDVRHRIASGEYAQGDRLPTTTEMCEHYGVSKITVKRAMDDLVMQGLVARRRGSGTYVKGAIATPALAGSENASHQMDGFTADGELLGIETSSDVHEFLVTQPPADIAQQLGMEADEFAYYVCRTRLADGKPQTVEHTYMPLKVIPDLRARHASESIYRYIENELGLKISSAHRVITAIHPSPEDASRLGISLDTPVISVRQVGYLDDGTPFELSIAIHSPGYEFFSVSTK